MNRPSEHTAWDFTVSLPAADYIARFRNAGTNRRPLPRLPELRAQLGLSALRIRHGRLPRRLSDGTDHRHEKITPTQAGLPFSEAARCCVPNGCGLNIGCWSWSVATQAVPSPMPGRVSTARQRGVRGPKAPRAGTRSG